MRPGRALAHPRCCVRRSDVVAKERFELPCPCGRDVLSVVCIPVPPLGPGKMTNSRMTNDEFEHSSFRHSSFDICQASPMGFEPMISTVTGWRSWVQIPSGTLGKCRMTNDGMTNVRIRHSSFGNSSFSLGQVVELGYTRRSER